MSRNDAGIMLRRAERRDLDMIIGWLDDPQFLAFIHGDPTRAPIHLRDRLMAMLGAAANPVFSATGFYILDSPEHGAVGIAALQDVQWRNRVCGFDVYVVPEARALDIDPACVDAVLRYAFGELQLHRIGREVRASDERAAQVMMDAGCRVEGVLRGHVLIDGKPEDVQCFGLLRAEYQGFAADADTAGS